MSYMTSDLLFEGSRLDHNKTKCVSDFLSVCVYT